MNISDYLSAALLNHSLGVAPYTMPSAVYAGLYGVAPTASGGGTEVTAADYVRVPMTFGLATTGTIATTADVRFPATGVTLSNWSNVLAMGILDSPTGGNLLFFGPLSALVTLGINQSFTIPATDLVITLS